jgi:GNAT superfamily N-acetyltransferase
MEDTRSGREIANRHWVDAFRDLIDDLDGEFRCFGTIASFVSSLPMAFANGCLVVEPCSPADAHEAISWVEAARVPFQVRVDEPLVPDLQTVLDAHRLEREPVPMPAMVLAPIPSIPAVPRGVSVARVDPAGYRTFLRLLESTGIPEDLAARVFPERLINSSHAAYFVASLDGAPAGISVAVRTGKSGGIYSVATLESARRRGVGTAVTWAAVDAIRGWGCTSAVLQSSEMGYAVYRAMGFEEVTRYVRFVPAESDSPPVDS